MDEKYAYLYGGPFDDMVAKLKTNDPHHIKISGHIYKRTEHKLGKYYLVYISEHIIGGKYA